MSSNKSSKTNTKFYSTVEEILKSNSGKTWAIQISFSKGITSKEVKQISCAENSDISTITFLDDKKRQAAQPLYLKRYE